MPASIDSHCWVDPHPVTSVCGDGRLGGKRRQRAIKDTQLAVGSFKSDIAAANRQFDTVARLHDSWLAGL
jgi:hypothetical protein